MNNPDGTEVVSLTKSGSVLVNNPVLSNDGTRIVYMEQSDIPNVVVMNSDGSNSKRYAVDGLSYPRYPAWSPDDNEIVFVANSTIRNFELYAINSDGSNLRQISDTDQIEEKYVHWSPVNEDILVSYTEARTSDNGLLLMNIDGSNRREITSPPGTYGYGKISPGGKEVIYTNRPGDCFQIFRMNIDGTNVRELTSENELDCAAIDGIDWSPDGVNIVFGSRLGASSYSIRTMPSDGSSPPVIISNTPGHPSYLYSPTWGEIKQ